MYPMKNLSLVHKKELQAGLKIERIKEGKSIV